MLWQAFGTVYPQAWEWMLYALIILTITVGNLFAMRQKNMKRFLAFSSISQAGYIMLGIIAFNPMGLAALMFYVLVYIFSNLAAFGVIGAIENASGKVWMDDYKGLYRTNPRLAFTMMLAMFSLARYTSVRRLLLEVLHLHKCDSPGNGSYLRPGADSALSTPSFRYTTICWW